jgi:hypothetical protein
MNKRNGGTEEGISCLLLSSVSPFLLFNPGCPPSAATYFFSAPHTDSSWIDQNRPVLPLAVWTRRT